MGTHHRIMVNKYVVLFLAVLFVVVGVVIFGANVATADAVPGITLEKNAIFDDVRLDEMSARAWGYAEGCETDDEISVEYMVEGESPFEYAYTILNAATLQEGCTANFSTYVSGVGPFVYEYDVYFQKFTRTDRSFSGYAHSISLSGEYSFTPSYPGRYIVGVTIEDANGNRIKYYTDAMFTATEDTVRKINVIAADARRAGNEYDSVVYIHNWLCENCEYSYTAGKYEADSVFNDGCAVCSGYSEAFNTICRAAGISAFSVHGYASASAIDGREHAWNVVRVEGDWYHIDVTRDDGATLEGSPLMTSVMCAQTHSFGVAVGGYDGETSVPPHCNATMYAADYEGDPIATGVRVTVSGVDDDADLTIRAGDVAKFIAETTPRCSRHATKLWTTTDANVATIDARGILTAVDAGACYVVVTCGDYTARRKITVID